MGENLNSALALHYSLSLYSSIVVKYILVYTIKETSMAKSHADYSPLGKTMHYDRWRRLQKPTSETVISIKWLLGVHESFKADPDLFQAIIGMVTFKRKYIKIPRTPLALNNLHRMPLPYRADEYNIYIEPTKEQLEKLDTIIAGRQLDAISKASKSMKLITWHRDLDREAIDKANEKFKQLRKGN